MTVNSPEEPPFEDNLEARHWHTISTNAVLRNEVLVAAGLLPIEAADGVSRSPNGSMRLDLLTDSDDMGVVRYRDPRDYLDSIENDGDAL